MPYFTAKRLKMGRDQTSNNPRFYAAKNLEVWG